jgi:hypothetical protein
MNGDSLTFRYLQYSRGAMFARPEQPPPIYVTKVYHQISSNIRLIPSDRQRQVPNSYIHLPTSLEVVILLRKIFRQNLRFGLISICQHSFQNSHIFIIKSAIKNYEGHLESKEGFAIKKYLLIIGKKKNM